MFNTTAYAKRAGKHAFGVDAVRTAQALQELADDIASGGVVVQSVSIASRAAHEEFTVRELTIEVLEETPMAGPRAVEASSPLPRLDRRG
jgi:hypothetical protein